MRTGITASVGLIFLVGITAASFGVGAPETTLPNFDKRGTVGAAQAVSAQQQAAAAALGAALSGAEVDFDPVTGGPKWVSAREKFLTGPGGAGLTVSAATAASYAGDAYGPTKAFLRDQSNLFGFGPEALGSAVKTREFTGAHNGLTTVVWQQQLSGIPIFEAVLISHTSKD